VLAVLCAGAAGTVITAVGSALPHAPVGC